MAAVKKYVLDTDGGLTSSGTDTITITTNRSISSGHQAAGFSLRFKAGGTNTGAATLNVDSLGAVAIKRLNGDALSAGDIVSGGIYDVAYDGTNYKLLGAGTGSGTYGTLSGSNTWSGTNVFQGSTTVGDDSSDVVVIKGTTVNAAMSALLSSGSITAFLDNVTGATTDRIMWRGASTWQAQTLPNIMANQLGSTKGNIAWYNGSAWVALTGVTPTVGNYKYLSLDYLGAVAWRDYV